MLQNYAHMHNYKNRPLFVFSALIAYLLKKHIANKSVNTGILIYLDFKNRLFMLSVQ